MRRAKFWLIVLLFAPVLWADPTPVVPPGEYLTLEKVNGAEFELGVTLAADHSMQWRYWGPVGNSDSSGPLVNGTYELGPPKQGKSRGTFVVKTVKHIGYPRP